ncbi:3-oxoadipyl-CoA thiolase domain protein [Acinetobacter baumannii IS-58]|nr:3-oxoadipyl-CoA thiolase domain protein [Acinetobacter baumannii IS-58]
MIYGCANQAGEDNRKWPYVSTLAGYRIRCRQPPLTVYAVHHSMHCIAARAIKAGEANLVIAVVWKA